MQQLDNLLLHNNNPTGYYTRPPEANPVEMEHHDRFTILIVDDEKAIRELIQLYLNSLGLHVIQAKNGIEALDYVKRCKIDLVLLDIVLPFLDGFAVCAAIRQDSEVPILMLTTINQLASAARAFQVGANGYITKPFTLDMLKTRLQTFINQPHPTDYMRR
ncbi:MAG: response regulator [Caldilineaceae bacterium]